MSGFVREGGQRVSGAPGLRFPGSPIQESGKDWALLLKLQQKLEITNPSGSGSRDQRPGY